MSIQWRPASEDISRTDSQEILRLLWKFKVATRTFPEPVEFSIPNYISLSSTLELSSHQRPYLPCGLLSYFPVQIL
jgi:hypothetical protein